jgi:hypothetical protein
MKSKSKFSITENKKLTLSEESALAVVKDFCLKFDIDIDAIEDSKQRKNQENLLNCIMDYVRRGIIEIGKDCSIVQHLQNDYGEGKVLQVNYKRITGEQKLVMDGKDDNNRYEMLYAVLGSASGMGEDFIRKLYGIDLKVAEALTIAFL